ncbi:MAG: hypothetical protein ACO3SM_02080 [Sedimenticolaceae bacterium]
MNRWLMFLLMLCAPAAWAAESWELKIHGHHRYVFGDVILQGYVQLPWEVSVTFTVDQGQFVAGSGLAQWKGSASKGSHPPQWFNCELLKGSYLDPNLKLLEMPRVRFSRFPIAGVIEQGQLTIRPGYEVPGNYLAIRYGCETRDPGAVEWFLFASRSKNEEGKRQDAEINEQGDYRSAVIREVKVLPPNDVVSMPLQDGWSFQQGHQEADYFATYQLTRR